MKIHHYVESVQDALANELIPEKAERVEKLTTKFAELVKEHYNRGDAALTAAYSIVDAQWPG